MEIDGALSAPTSNHNLFHAQPESFTPQGIQSDLASNIYLTPILSS